MNLMKIATAILIMMMLQTTLSTVSGGGFLSENDENKVIPWENRELAYITVMNSTEMELELFIDIYSMQPGENISVFLPLRTAPLSIFKLLLFLSINSVGITCLLTTQPYTKLIPNIR